LSKIVENFSDSFSLVVEVRHKSWQQPEALDFLQQLGVTVCNLDYPVASNSFNMQYCTVGTAGYFRMHGRNVEKWFSKAGRDETYDYYYNDNELAQIKRRIDRLAEAFKSLTVIAAQGAAQREQAAGSGRAVKDVSESGRDCPE
jgi:uncharacterized protein YecE (DUF72 family)